MSDNETTYDATKDIMVQDYGTIPGTDIHVELKRYETDGPGSGQERLSVYEVVGKKKDKTRRIFRVSVETARTIAAFVTKNVGVAEPAKR